nr:RNA-directed DNA polymerase, eukaryota, reverse transcriptase zinc-binding domain protein [Tanacetum cinerariifolium]
NTHSQPELDLGLKTQDELSTFLLFVSTQERRKLKKRCYAQVVAVKTTNHYVRSRGDKNGRILVYLVASLGNKNEQTGQIYGDGRLIRFKKKLQDLKKIIRTWIKDKNVAQSSVKRGIIDDLVAIDKSLDCGVVYDEMLPLKSKVKWAIEGDENSKFFHGLINKKRS